MMALEKYGMLLALIAWIRKSCLDSEHPERKFSMLLWVLTQENNCICETDAACMDKMDIAGKNNAT